MFAINCSCGRVSNIRYYVVKKLRFFERKALKNLIGKNKENFLIKHKMNEFKLYLKIVRAGKKLLHTYQDTHSHINCVAFELN